MHIERCREENRGTGKLNALMHAERLVGAHPTTKRNDFLLLFNQAGNNKRIKFQKKRLWYDWFHKKFKKEDDDSIHGSTYDFLLTSNRSIGKILSSKTRYYSY